MSDREKMSADKLDAYWKDMVSRRMPEEDEISRLITVMKGFYFDNMKWRSEEPTENFNFYEHIKRENFIEFHGSKRPYGCKDVESSIAFNLGWDYKRQLCYHQMPEEIKAICQDLHAKVKLTLKGDSSYVYY